MFLLIMLLLYQRLFCLHGELIFWLVKYIIISFINFMQLGAIAVNLVSGEKPADVYSGIATR
jgi:hypothetical protein